MYINLFDLCLFDVFAMLSGIPSLTKHISQVREYHYYYY
jgi:hypothetical protein